MTRLSALGVCALAMCIASSAQGQVSAGATAGARVDRAPRSAADPSQPATDASGSSAVADANGLATDLPPTPPATETPALDANVALPEAAAEAAPSPQALAEQQVLQEVYEAMGHIEEQAAEYRTETRKIGEYRYKQQHDAQHVAAEQIIGPLEKEQRNLRDAAIAKFEAFLKKYPTSPRYAPDAMFRLSELYFERSGEELIKQRQDYEKALADWNPDSGAPGPEEPVVHYEHTIDLMQRLITGFPSYRLADGAYYLLGYCLSEQGEEDRAVDAFRELVARKPDSRFAAEVWTRIGEYYFNTNKLDRAVQAYTQVLKFPDSPYYDKALYKLAWTHYRLADPERAPHEFQKAVDTFVQLLDFNEKTKTEGHERGGDLRAESFEYIAVSYAEEHWGNLDKMVDYFNHLGGRPYERDALMALGNVYFDQTRFPEAIRAYRKALEMAPFDAKAPEAQDKIVLAYERMRDFESAARERELLTRTYGVETPWYAKNREDADALSAADKLINKALLSAALFHHRQAQTYRDAKRIADAKSEYGKAAAAYGQFLERYPNDKDAYNLTFAYADCLYYSLQFLKAADVYATVRDSQTDNKLQEDAAFSVVSAYEGAIKQAEEKGQLAPMAVLKSTERKTHGKLSPQEVPELKKKMINASDIFTKLLPKSDKSPRVMYAAAEIFYTYDRFDDARTRFGALLDAYPRSDVARFAANLIIESYLTEEDYAAVEAFAQSLLTSGKIVDPAFLAELTKFKTGAQFQIANALAAKGEYEKAAEQYIKMVDANPRNEFADKALNNAAVAYEHAKRFDSASRVYERLVREYPRSALADNALFRVGLNAEHFFNFDKAIAAYLQLEAKYPKSDKRADALYNAATALENTQNYERAAVEFERYCKLFPHRDDAPQVCFRAGAALEKTGQWRRVIVAYEHFVKQYQHNAANKDRVLEAMLRLARAHAKLGQAPLAHRFYEQAVKVYNHGGGDPKSAPFAAEAQFNVIDDVFARFRKIPIQGTGKQQAKALVAKAKQLSKLQQEYLAVLKFKQIEWTLASLFRIGELYQNFAESMVNAPCPPDVQKAARKMGASKEEVCDEYRVLLEEKATGAEDKAVQAYQTAVTKAKELQVANDWTQRTLAALNKLRRAEFPLQKTAKSFVDATAIDIPPVVGVTQTSRPTPAAPGTPSEAPPGAS